MKIMKSKEQTRRILDELIKLLDIPLSYYEKAVSRYRSMAAHFLRTNSSIRHLDPLVHSQGSFRLGTVIRPLAAGEGYDLDLVCRLALEKGSYSQKQLKDLVGEEVKSYSLEQGFTAPPSEGKRCWTQQYQDVVDFHMDILPSIPAEENYRQLLLDSGVDESYRNEAIDITDQTLPNYQVIDPNWPRSNPRGYAFWFESRMDVGEVASRARRAVFDKRPDFYQSIDDVPVYELKTPLQRAVQLLKRHRDQMFQGDPDGKPISIIITTLAAKAYAGESDLADALGGILDGMDGYVLSSGPRIQNPVAPAEDFADRWDAELEKNFWRWLRQAKEDFEGLDRVTTEQDLVEEVGGAFGVSMEASAAQASLFGSVGAPAVIGLTKVADTAAPSWGSS